jgi:hypothetical protein
MKVKETYPKGRNVVLHKGDLVRFWRDPWLDNKPLCDPYPQLFDIALAQEVTLFHGINNNFDIPFGGGGDG